MWDTKQIFYLWWAFKVHPRNRKSSDIHCNTSVEIECSYNEEEPPAYNWSVKKKKRKIITIKSNIAENRHMPVLKVLKLQLQNCNKGSCPLTTSLQKRTNWADSKYFLQGKIWRIIIWKPTHIPLFNVIVFSNYEFYKQVKIPTFQTFPF